MIIDEKFLDAYRTLKSVWKVAKLFGVSGQYVHKRLTKLNAIIKPNYLNDEEKKIIIDFYKNDLKLLGLDYLAKKLGRTKSFISRFARSQNLTDKNFKMDESVTKKRVLKNCILCGSEFYASGHIGSKKLCSAACRYKCSSDRLKKWHSENEHPRGMLNKHHSAECCKEISRRMKDAWMDKNSAFNSESNKQKHSDIMSKLMISRYKNKSENIYSRTTKGWLEVGNKKYFFRSKWEMNYAIFLEFLKKNKSILDWEYEVDTFWFEKIKRGVRSYTPDFKVTNNDNSIEYHEVKGWMDNKSKTKLNRMRIYFPEIKIVLIDEKRYKELKKQSVLFGFI